jgi:hypothetical protein
VSDANVDMGEVTEQSRVTEQEKTQHNTTQHNKTKQNKTGQDRTGQAVPKFGPSELRGPRRQLTFLLVAGKAEGPEVKKDN